MFDVAGDRVVAPALDGLPARASRRLHSQIVGRGGGKQREESSRHSGGGKKQENQNLNPPDERAVTQKRGASLGAGRVVTESCAGSRLLRADRWALRGRGGLGWLTHAPLAGHKQAASGKYLVLSRATSSRSSR